MRGTLGDPRPAPSAGWSAGTTQPTRPGPERGRPSTTGTLTWEFELDAQTAACIRDVCFDVGTKLNDSLVELRARGSEEEFTAYRRVVAQVMGTILVDVLNPIFAAHPRLEPDELKVDP